MCSDALADEPDCVPLLLIRARAHIALRRDLDAQSDLRDIIRFDPQCATAYRLLGELAARRDENESAAIFFREALRLDPHDQEAADWLLVVDTSSSSFRPAAAAQQIPAPAAAAGRFPERIASGTRPPMDLHDERPTRPFARGSDRFGDRWRTPAPMLAQRTVTMGLDVEVIDEPTELVAKQPPKVDATPAPLPPPPRWGEASDVRTIHGRPPTTPPARPARAITARPMPRPTIAEAPGFGDYLVAQGILTRERLRAAQAYQRSMKVQLSTAIVTLGLASPQRIEWAAVAHHSHLASSRQD